MCARQTDPATLPGASRPALPNLTVETIQEYLTVVARGVYAGTIPDSKADRLIACARCLVLAATGQDEPHTAQP